MTPLQEEKSADEREITGGTKEPDRVIQWQIAARQNAERQQQRHNGCRTEIDIVLPAIVAGFNLREAIYIFIGLTLPILFWFSFCFVVEIPYWNVATALISFEWKSNIKWIIFYSETGFLSLISLLHYLGVTPQQVIKTRKMRSLVFIYLILAGLIMALRMAIIWEWTFPFLTLVPIVIFISGLLNKVTVSKLGTFLLYLSWATWLYASFS
jgi:hypothetical protein